MEYKVLVDINEFNENNDLKLVTYPKLLSLVSYLHLRNTSQGVGEVIANKYAWVLVSMKIDIIGKLTNLDVFGNTWYSGNRGPYYRREYQLFSGGEVFVNAASYSVLLNMDSRTVYREKELPFEKLLEVKKHLVDLKSGIKEELSFKEIYKGKVTNSMIDVFNHVNNLKYSEICYDALNSEEIKMLNSLKSVELYFHKEMTLNNEFTVYKVREDNIINLVVHNTTTNIKAFTMKLIFNN